MIGMALLVSMSVNAQKWQGKFEQLGTILPTPNEYRTASGSPGDKYWQQKADYKINVSIDEHTLVLKGDERITYYNNAPEPLDYLWIQLDQNVRKPNALSWQVRSTRMRDTLAAKSMMRITGDYMYEGGFHIKSVTNEQGESMAYTINETMMRIDLASPLKPGSSISFSITWWYNMYDRMKLNGRGGYEYFPNDDNYAFTLTQWYPRMAVFDDVEGWQNKQFLGRGEFALTFGDFDVSITVPSDYIMAATGELQNADEVLTKKQADRFSKAKKSTERVFIVTQKEAEENEKSKATATKTWHFKAVNVRDFAWTSSRKYIWDAKMVPLEHHHPLAMSFYPKEGNPLWGEQSTEAVANTLRTYSHYTIDYPYPVAISVHAANQGMEYPMICFNYGRPKKNGEYSERLLEGMVSVIVHEVGHNFFPMIINSDERQWTWMDEGLNTFLEHRTLKENYPGFELSWGTPKGIVNYMKGNPDFIRPIMTNSEQIRQFGYNAYGKPSAALVLLRETIMGPKLFDKAFKTYAQRWAFKRPMPADFFRTMEDASAVDLDWFWRGWFYGTDHVDVEVSNVRWFRLNQGEKGFEKKIAAGTIASPGGESSSQTNQDFSKSYTPLTLKDTDPRFYGEFKNRIDDDAVRNSLVGKNIYEVTFKNDGGLVTPIIIEWTYKDGTKEVEKIPAEIWRMNENEVKKVFVKDKEVVNITLDPNQETADTNVTNNYFPKRHEETKVEKFKNSN